MNTSTNIINASTVLKNRYCGSKIKRMAPEIMNGPTMHDYYERTSKKKKNLEESKAIISSLKQTLTLIDLNNIPQELEYEMFEMTTKLNELFLFNHSTSLYNFFLNRKITQKTPKSREIDINSTFKENNMLAVENMTNKVKTQIKKRKLSNERNANCNKNSEKCEKPLLHSLSEFICNSKAIDIIERAIPEKESQQDHFHYASNDEILSKYNILSKRPSVLYENTNNDGYENEENYHQILRNSNENQNDINNESFKSFNELDTYMFCNTETPQSNLIEIQPINELEEYLPKKCLKKQIDNKTIQNIDEIRAKNNENLNQFDHLNLFQKENDVDENDNIPSETNLEQYNLIKQRLQMNNPKSKRTANFANTSTNIKMMQSKAKELNSTLRASQRSEWENGKNHRIISKENNKKVEAAELKRLQEQDKKERRYTITFKAQPLPSFYLKKPQLASSCPQPIEVHELEKKLNEAKRKKSGATQITEVAKKLNEQQKKKIEKDFTKPPFK